MISMLDDRSPQAEGARVFASGDAPRPTATRGWRPPEVLLVVRERDVALEVADAVRRRRPTLDRAPPCDASTAAAAAQRRVEFEVEVQLVEVRHRRAGSSCSA